MNSVKRKAIENRVFTGLLLIFTVSISAQTTEPPTTPEANL